MAIYQLEYRDLIMGLGTNFHVVGIEGLENDEVRMGDAALPRAGGDIPGLHVASARQVTMNVLIKGNKDSQALRDDVQAFIDAFQHSDEEFKLYFDEPGFTERRYVWARPAGRSSKRDPRYPFQPAFVVRLKLADPRAYRETADQDTMGVFSASGGGLDYDITDYGKDYAVDASSLMVMENSGNANAWPIIRFYGPTSGTVTEVTLTNETTGVALVMATTMLSGEILTVDMHNIVTVKPTDQHVIRLGVTNKYTDWQQPRDPFYLAPGSNTLKFEVSGGTSTDASCVVTFNDTWL